MLMLMMPLPGRPKLRAQEQAPTVLRSPGDVVEPAGLGESPLLAVEDVAIDARLQAVLVVGEGVEAEVEQALSVSLAHGVGEEESQQALPVVRLGLAEQASERPEGSHFARLCALQPRRGASRAVLEAVFAQGRWCLSRTLFALSRGGRVLGESCLGLGLGLGRPGSHSLGTVSHGIRV